MSECSLSSALVAAAFVVSCRGPSGRKVTAEELGDRWPLTVTEGVVDCVRRVFHLGSQPVDAAIFRSGGKVYALGGMAQGQGYEEIDPIWKDNPNPNIPKMNIGPLIDLALEQCE